MPVVPDGVLRAESAQRHCLPGTLAEDGGIFADKAAWPKEKKKAAPRQTGGDGFLTQRHCNIDDIPVKNIGDGPIFM